MGVGPICFMKVRALCHQAGKVIFNMISKLALLWSMSPYTIPGISVRQSDSIGRLWFLHFRAYIIAGDMIASINNRRDVLNILYSKVLLLMVISDDHF